MKLQAICVIGGPEGKAPTKLRVWVAGGSAARLRLGPSRCSVVCYRRSSHVRTLALRSAAAGAVCLVMGRVQHQRPVLAPSPAPCPFRVVNRDDLDFATVNSMAVTQEWDLQEDNGAGLLEYPTQ